MNIVVTEAHWFQNMSVACGSSKFCKVRFNDKVKLIRVTTYEEFMESCREKFAIPDEASCISLSMLDNTIIDSDSYEILTGHFEDTLQITVSEALPQQEKWPAVYSLSQKILNAFPELKDLNDTSLKTDKTKRNVFLRSICDDLLQYSEDKLYLPEPQRRYYEVAEAIIRCAPQLKDLDGSSNYWRLLLIKYFKNYRQGIRRRGIQDNGVSPKLIEFSEKFSCKRKLNKLDMTNTENIGETFDDDEHESLSNDVGLNDDVSKRSIILFSESDEHFDEYSEFRKRKYTAWKTSISLQDEIEGLAKPVTLKLLFHEAKMMLHLYTETKSDYHETFPYEVDEVGNRMKDIFFHLYDMFKVSMKRWHHAHDLLQSKNTEIGETIITSFKLLSVRFKNNNPACFMNIYDDDFMGFTIGKVHFVAENVEECIGMSILSYIGFNIIHPSKMDGPFETLEFLMGIRRRTTLTMVRSFLNELPPSLTKLVQY